MNRHLRTIWRRVHLDRDMVATVEWGIPEVLYADEALAQAEARAYGPEEA